MLGFWDHQRMIVTLQAEHTGTLEQGRVFVEGRRSLNIMLANPVSAYLANKAVRTDSTKDSAIAKLSWASSRLGIAPS